MSALTIRNLTKRYPGVAALTDVSLDVRVGEIHAIIGENGAGKSTLIKSIAGAITPDDGVISLFGKNYGGLTPALSRSEGVEVIYQEFNLCMSLTCAENISLGSRFGRWVSRKPQAKVAQDLFDQFGIALDPLALVRDLPIGQQQIVEIAKAVSKSARLLIMDEPTAPLSVAETRCLFQIIRKLKNQGVTIVFISHRLDEIFELCDRVSILRDGRYVTTLEVAATDHKALIGLMVGRELTHLHPASTGALGPVALEVRNLSGNGNTDVSFSVRQGEILGLAGLVGAGRTEVAQVIFGLAPKTGGQILVDGAPVDIRSPYEAMKLGLGLIPEDRKTQGCFLEKPIGWNITFARLPALSRRGVIDVGRERSLVERFKALLDIRSDAGQSVRNLSGGNQQKVVLAKTLATESRILIFDEPTRGIDVGAKHEIYKLMVSLASQGCAIVMISSDMEELLGMANRLVVLCEGRVTGELERSEFRQERVLELASGLTLEKLS